jgi:indolepyruvate ferredoxin oxidoreductase, beta subunit
MSEITNIAIVGVGGQGILLAGDVIALAAMQAGYDVKKNELHGMAQRGGSVTSEVRLGRNIHSPVVSDGEVDVLVAMEVVEALRAAHRLRPEGVIVTDTLQILPAARVPGAPVYPKDAEKRLKKLDNKVIALAATDMAREAGNARAANVVLLGALSCHLDLPTEIWQNALAALLRPNLLEVNLRAFAAGRAYALKTAKRKRV